MTACVFLGPSLPRKAAEALLLATYLPPARRGDVLRALRDHAPETIVLIDGYFEQVPAVWHKELLWAIRAGVTVCGAASMGALRAAELAQFGMEGAGRIFESYRSGRFAPWEDPFDGDDEVAVLHGPAELGFVAASEALVDIRAVLAAAMDAGVATATEGARLLDAARAVFYKQRGWKQVFDAALAAGFEAARAEEISDWVAQHRFSQKRLDAEVMLRQVAQGGVRPIVPPFRFERTLLWDRTMPDYDTGDD